MTFWTEKHGDLADGVLSSWIRFQNLILLAAKKPKFSG